MSVVRETIVEGQGFQTWLMLKVNQAYAHLQASYFAKRRNKHARSHPQTIQVGSRKDLCVVFERGGAVNLLGDVSQLARRIV